MEHFTAILALVAVIIGCYYWSVRTYLKVALKMPGPTALPLIGNLFDFLATSDGIEDVDNIFKNFGHRARAWLATLFIYLTINPKDVKIILTDDNSLDKSLLFMKGAERLIPEGLVITHAQKWRKQRKAFNPGFTKSVLDVAMDQIYARSEVLVAKLRDFGDEPRDIYHHMFEFILDSFCKNFANIEIEEINKKYGLSHVLMKHNFLSYQRMLNPLLTFDCLYNLTARSKEFRECVRKIRAFTDDITAAKREQFEKFGFNPDVKRRTAIDLIFEPNSVFQDEQEKKNNYIMMVMGGTESTSLVLSFAALILGGHPEIQKQLHEEVLTVVGRKRPITVQDLVELKYTERFVCEILRLFPGVPLLVRHVTKDLDLGHCTIPMGTHIVISPFSLHRDPTFWPDPLKFDPDRFLPEQVAVRDPYTYIPFSMGPRNCIGLKYAMMVSKAGIANLVRNFEFKSNYDSVDKIRTTGYYFLNTTHGFKCSIKQRP